GGEGALDELASQPLDHLFYTGSETVGRRVYQLAAQQLTPVTLQLGGKSPVIVVDGHDWKTIGRRIAYGKFSNAGQSLVSPDYLIAVGYDVATKAQDAVIDAVEDFYGPNPGEAKQFGRMITPDHTQRLVNLLQATMKGAVAATPARPVYGGKYNSESAYLAPTILADVDPNTAIMQEQILGPILPILVVDTYDEAMELANSMPTLAHVDPNTARRQYQIMGPILPSLVVGTYDEAMELANSMPTPPAAYGLSVPRRIRRGFMHRINAGAAVMSASVLQASLPALP